jgi:hypothetical protein
VERARGGVGKESRHDDLHSLFGCWECGGAMLGKGLAFRVGVWVGGGLRSAKNEQNVLELQEVGRKQVIYRVDPGCAGGRAGNVGGQVERGNKPGTHARAHGPRDEKGGGGEITSDRRRDVRANFCPATDLVSIEKK